MSKYDSPLALPLGELSPQVTERVLQDALSDLAMLGQMPSLSECSPLALPLGELSPQVTERVLQLGLFALSDLAMLGHLSHRERQGMPSFLGSFFVSAKGKSSS